MEKRTTKQFSSVRYWRYIFTPLVFLAIGFSVFMLYSRDGVKLPTKPVLEDLVAKANPSFSSLLNSLAKSTK